MKTAIKYGHRRGELRGVTDLKNESCFEDGSERELAIVDVKAKSSAILRAAAKVFAERGYQAATVEAIAECACIAKGTVYLYFHSKQELFFRICDDYIAAIKRIGKQAIERSSTTAASQIRQSIHTLLVMSTETRDLFPLLLELWSASTSTHRHARAVSSFRGAYSQFLRLIADQIRKGQQEGEFDRSVDASQVAVMLLGALDGTLLQAWFDPGLDPVSIGDQVVTILLHSLITGRRQEASNRKPA